jgi:hypothetical protein
MSAIVHDLKVVELREALSRTSASSGEPAYDESRRMPLNREDSHWWEITWHDPYQHTIRFAFQL